MTNHHKPTAPGHSTPVPDPASPVHSTPVPDSATPGHSSPATPGHSGPATPGHSAPAHPPTSIEKEFELERMILFTDAVFAIAITLLIIDIKWPDLPQDLKGDQLFHLFRPTIVGFLAFATSFLYIGRSWVVHLRLFRLLRKYDQGLINRNLFFLFFIVVFPFTNAGLAHYDSVTFMLPAIIYLANLALVGITHYLLCRYIIVEKPSLSVAGQKEEKKFIYTRGRYTMFITGAMPIIAIALWLLFPEHPVYVLYSFVLLPVGLRFIKRRLKSLRPAVTDES